MKKLLLGQVALTVLALAAPVAAQAQADPDARAAAVEAQMTDDERFQLIHSIMPIAFGGVKPPPGVKATAGYIPGIPRLGIPPMFKTDASLGIVNPGQQRPGDVATALPAGLATAATFNRALTYQGGAMIGAEAKAKGFNVLLGGGMNLTRDPRGGRNFEYLGEDPLLAGSLAAEAIRGTQSQGVVSTMKHFAINDQETHRNTINAVIDEGELRESDLLAFQIAFERGQPGSVMCAYNRVNGPWACGSDFLLNQVLKKEWGFKGWVMSDWGAVHEWDYAIKGLDQQAGANLDKEIWFDKTLREQVASGRVPKARISDMVRRILRSLYAVKADGPIVERPIDYVAHAKVARAVAQEGIVLLKNDKALPLARDAKTILLVGGHADIGVMSGGGSSQVTPVGGQTLAKPLGGSNFFFTFSKMLFAGTSPLKGLRDALPKAKISYESGYYPEHAVLEAKKADVVIVFATHWQSEGFDAGSMTLPEGQDQLISAMARANPNTIVVLETGNPVKMPWLNEVKAVLAAWYPGQEGGAAIADILTGEVNPSGRLPITFPVSESQNPRPEIPGLDESDPTKAVVNYPEGSDAGYRWFAAHGVQPQFAFGHGLSYTSFRHSKLSMKGSPEVTATFTVTNSGDRAGADVPQLYLVDAAGRKLQRLAAFDKIRLRPGESKKLTVKVDPRILADWINGAWQINAGTYTFALGTSANSLGQTASVRLSARRWGPNGAAGVLASR